MTHTFTRTAELTVDRPEDETLPLFTAEGERRWAPGWDPAYPVAGRTRGPGAVFETAHGDHTTTWVMTDDDASGVRYARVTPGLAAGTVTVAIAGATDTADTAGATRVRVTYDLTALSEHGAAWLTEFEAGYDTEIAEWETLIAQSR